MFSIVHWKILVPFGHKDDFETLSREVNNKLDEIKKLYSVHTRNTCTLIQARAILQFKIAQVKELSDFGYITEKDKEALQFRIQTWSSELDSCLFRIQTLISYFSFGMFCRF